MELYDYLLLLLIGLIGGGVGIAVAKGRQLYMISQKLTEQNTTLERKLTEETIKHQQYQHLFLQQAKMAQMGEMIGAIAHQWRQPLNALSIAIQDLLDAYNFNELDKVYLEKMVGESLRKIHFMSKTIEDFRNFFNPQRIEENFDPKKAIEDIFELINAQFYNNEIEVKIRCALETKQENILPVYGNANEFKQAILNIASNAKDAIIHHRLHNHHGKKREKGTIEVEFFQHSQRLQIKIRDNGGGIAPEVQNSLFSPYVTTKGNEGTGIGLYLSKLIIEKNMGGQLSCHNLEQGAEFIIELPVSSAKH